MEWFHGALGIIVIGGLVVGLHLEQGQQSFDQDWQDIELQAVDESDPFTIRSLDRPVLVETFEVWCSTCTRQQQEVKSLKEDVEFESVTLGTDPNQNPGRILEHKSRYGFDWRYAIAPQQMIDQLRAEYGNEIAHPPSAPMILVCENGTRQLPSGVKPASDLAEEIEAGC